MKPKAIRIASYNVKHCAEGTGKIAGVLRALGADLCGLQEIDCGTERTGFVDQAAVLAKEAGYPYYRFTKSIDYRGGEYGTLILSAYPIVSYEHVVLDAGSREGRAVGHVKVDLGGTLLDFFNTHLSYEGKEYRTVQFGQLRELLRPCARYILTGDFNTQDFSEFAPLEAALLVNRTGSRHVTFPGSSSAIDNIVCSEGFSELSAGTVTQSFSDHSVLYAQLGIAD